jgi:hypothetical protein
VHRARLIRLGKVAVEQDGEKKVVISFSIEALALLHVTEVTGLAEGLRDFFFDAADDIEQRLTPDPPDVSPPIKLPEGITHERAAKRLRLFDQRVAEALDNRYDEQLVRQALADVFPEQLPDRPALREVRLRSRPAGRQRHTRRPGGARVRLGAVEEHAVVRRPCAGVSPSPGSMTSGSACNCCASCAASSRTRRSARPGAG